MVKEIHPNEHQLNKTSISNIEASFLDLNLSISIEVFATNIYDK